MNDRELLERAGERMRQDMRPPEEIMQRVHRMRERRERARKVGTIVVAFAVAAAGFGGLLAAFLGGRPERSAGQPTGTVTTANVRNLGLAWTGRFAPAVNTPNGQYPVLPDRPVVGDGMVFVSSFTTIYAFPQDCNVRAGLCAPAWSYPIGAQQWYMSQPAVFGNQVFVTAVGQVSGSNVVGSDAHLYAFPVACGTDGSTCRPNWTADLGVGQTLGVAVSGDGTVFVDGYSQSTSPRTGFLAAFPANCTGVCHPLWKLRLGGAVAAPPLVGEGVVAVSVESTSPSLLVFPTACRGNPCASTPAPVAKIALSERFYPKIIWSGIIIGSTPDSVAAYPSACSGRTCRALWTSLIPDTWGSDFSLYSGGYVMVPSPIESGHQVRLAALPVTCPRGSCQPAVQATVPGGRLTARSGNVIFGAGSGLFAYESGCLAAGKCPSIWTGIKWGSAVDGVAVSGGTVYATSGYSGLLYAFDLSSGPMRAPLSIAPPKWAGPPLGWVIGAGILLIFLVASALALLAKPDRMPLSVRDLWRGPWGATALLALCVFVFFAIHLDLVHLHFGSGLVQTTMTASMMRYAAFVLVGTAIATAVGWRRLLFFVPAVVYSIAPGILGGGDLTCTNRDPIAIGSAWMTRPTCYGGVVYLRQLSVRGGLLGILTDLALALIPVLGLMLASHLKGRVQAPAPKGNSAASTIAVAIWATVLVVGASQLASAGQHPLDPMHRLGTLVPLFVAGAIVGVSQRRWWWVLLAFPVLMDGALADTLRQTL